MYPQSTATETAGKVQKRWLLAGVLAIVATVSAGNAGAQCNQLGDVDGALFTYSPGAVIDRLAGEVENASLNVHGWIKAKYADPNREALVALHILQKPQGDILDRNNWRYLNYDTTNIGGFGYFAFSGVTFTNAEVPDGGVGRYRGLTVWYNSCSGQHISKALKPYVDESAPSLGTDTMGLQMHSGIVADVDPKPSARTNTAYLGHGRPQFDPGLRGAAADAETLEYYRAVGTSATGGGDSIETALPNLKAFHERYFKGRPELTASYYNDGDLGVGREMHCSFDLPAGERACYVSNYAPCTVPLLPNGRCDKPIFGDRAGSIAAQKRAGAVPFATVAMVERSQIPANQANSTFFAVYVCTGSNCVCTGDACPERAQHTLFNKAVALDGHGVSGVGSNTFNPGNCMTCHGAGGRYDKGLNATFGAYFLPFDMDAFEYLESSSTSPLSRAGVHNAMRAMNKEIALESHLKGVGNATRLIANWYDGDFQNGTFNGARSPNDLGFRGVTQNGATTHESSGALYANVYGAACRGCHITHPTLQLSKYADWQSLGAFIARKVCVDQVMPLAERTQNMVWDELIRHRLLQHLGVSSTACNTNLTP